MLSDSILNLKRKFFKITKTVTGNVFYVVLDAFKMAVLLGCVSPPAGHFKNYTAYQVSLITVSHSGECHRISSVIEYSGQGSKLFCIV